MGFDDKELVARAKSGDRNAFDRLVLMYKDRMFGLTYRMTGDREAALDLMQDTFFSAFKEIKRFRGEASFSSWLYKIASNKALNYLRRKKLLSLLFLEDSPQVEPVYEMKEDIDAGKLAGAIEAGVRALPPKQKLVFNLRFYDKLQFGEIAKIAGKSESTVKTNYQKALENLRKRLESYR